MIMAVVIVVVFFFVVVVVVNVIVVADLLVCFVNGFIQWTETERSKLSTSFCVNLLVVTLIKPLKWLCARFLSCCRCEIQKQKSASPFKRKFQQ